MKVKKHLKIFFVFITIFMLNQHGFASAGGFSELMRQFIQDGKQIRLVLPGVRQSLELTPVQNIDIIDLQGHKKISLKKDIQYLVKVYEEKPDWEIQVLATSNQEKARSFTIQLNELGIQSYYQLIDGLYKVRSGKYQTKEEAEKIASQLESDGWQTWVYAVEKKKETLAEIAIYNPDGEILFKARDIKVAGSYKLAGKIYPGESELFLSPAGIKVFNTIHISDLVSGILASKSVKINSKARSGLKAEAIVIRTSILNKLFNHNTGTIIFLDYQGTGSDNESIRIAVNSTTGQILTNAGEIITIPDYNLTGVETDTLDYRQILNSAYPEYLLNDLTEIVEEETLVDARVKWGLNYKEVRQLTWWGPRVITILELRFDRFNFRLTPVLANEKIAGLEDLNQMVLRKGALAGINGGYFTYTGRPLGLVMIDGQMISEPIKNRSAFGITLNNQFLIDQISWQGIVSDLNGDINLIVSGVNRKPNQNETVIFNHYYGKYAPNINDNIVEMVVADNRIIEINNPKKTEQTEIPENGFVIQARGKKKAEIEKFTVGEIINYRNDFTPDWENNFVISALGAGPMLIKNGEIKVTAETEEFQPDIARGRAPRSALGINDQGHLLFFTIDGRQPKLSIGISLKELARFMLDYGVVNGLNLDGGGSARMVVRGFTMNNPSDQRFISNGLIISSPD